MPRRGNFHRNVKFETYEDQTTHPLRVLGPERRRTAPLLLSVGLDRMLIVLYVLILRNFSSASHCDINFQTCATKSSGLSF